MTPRRMLLGTAALTLAALLGTVVCEPADGHLFIFKDGFVLQGRPKYKNTTLSGDGFSTTTPVPGEPYWIDDGVRNIYFSVRHLQEMVEEEVKKTDLKFTRPAPTKGAPLPVRWEIDYVGPWDQWERTVTMSIPGNKNQIKFVQRIAQMNPETIRVESERYDWPLYYKTKEVSPTLLRKLLYQYFDKLKDNEGKDKDIEFRGKVYRFLLQAGFLDDAAEELKLLTKSYPEEESKVAPLLDHIQRVQAVQLVEALERSHKANLHADVMEKLGLYAKADVSKLLEEKGQLRVQAIKDKYAALADKIKEANRLLKGFTQIVPPHKTEFYTAVAGAILEDLNADTVGRLDTFLSQAQDYERAFKDKRKPEQTAEEVMAFAMTGWLRGNDGAERSPAVAIKQWEIRQILLDYLKTEDAATRKNKLLPLLAGKGLTVDEAVQFLKVLPPPDPIELKGDKPMQLQAGKGGANYEVQLPSGYHHQRAWPVLIVLHHSEEKAEGALKRWAWLATQHGYIVAAPQWGKGIHAVYGFTAAEHAAVLDTLRDLRRRFQVDSDRVFLFGGEQGGIMAFDVGLSHPDQFAGVMPMAATPMYFAPRYWPNAQYLPFYIVNGEKTAGATVTKAMYKDWNRNHYPSFFVEYKGRLAEWFGAEQPVILDWMNRKTRLHPTKEVGRPGEEFKTQRTTDNQFYWIGTDAILPAHLNSAAKWMSNSPATLAAGVYNDNTIIIKTAGVRSVTLWFGPKLIEYKDKVTIRLNGDAPFTKMITPSLETLLETLYQTGDRQQLYFARLDLNWK